MLDEFCGGVWGLCVEDGVDEDLVVVGGEGEVFVL